jgi:hypothetical protein
VASAEGEVTHVDLDDREADIAGVGLVCLGTQDTSPAMAHVYEFGGHLNAVWSNVKSVYVRDIPGEWSGPLEPPT